MSPPSASESCEKAQLKSINLQSLSSIESLIKVVGEPSILPYYKPIDYVEVLAQIHEQLESCSPEERSNLYWLQYQVFMGLGETNLMQRSLHSAWLKSSSVYEKLVFGAWQKYAKQYREISSDLFLSASEIASELPVKSVLRVPCMSDDPCCPMTVSFQIGDEIIACDRLKIAGLSAPFHAMLNGCFIEASSDIINLSENDISSSGMVAINSFSSTGSLSGVAKDLLLEILVFANRFCCDSLKDACDRKLASTINSRQDAMELLEYAIEENSPVLAASCLQVFLHELPDSLNDPQVVELLSTQPLQQRSIMFSSASFFLYSLLAEVSMNSDPSSDRAVIFSKQLVECAKSSRQKMIALHKFGCVRFLRKEYEEAEELFEHALREGHIYSSVGLIRINHINGPKHLSYEKVSSVISLSSHIPLGWMYQERSLYCEDDKRCEDLEKATELDPTLTYPYMYRAASLMRKHDVEAALAEINTVLEYKLALECLELRLCFYVTLKDYKSAISDVNVILTLSPDYQMFDGRVAASQLRFILCEHVEKWTTSDCWLQLYDRCSLVDDIGSLSVIYQMLESYADKGILYFRQYILLLRLNFPEAAMCSLQLARQHASSEQERLVYEGWIMYDTGHWEEGLKKADESINLQKSFEALFLKAYILDEPRKDQSSTSTVVSLLGEALKCPSDKLREGQALCNLGSAYIDCGELDEAADCYTKAISIHNTKAHQGLARVHFLRNDSDAAYEEMTKLVNKARNKAFAYEKRSDYCEHDLRLADLAMATHLDPLLIYPYRYRAATLMDMDKAEEAVAEVSKAIALKAEAALFSFRAEFNELIGDSTGALRDCRAALLIDSHHPDMMELFRRLNPRQP